MGVSVADQMYRNRNRQSSRKNRRTGNSSGVQQSVPGSTESDTHKRLYYVIDNIVAMIPEEMQDSPMAKMLIVFAREGKKDIRKIPEEFIAALSRQIGESFTWVADGDMSDIERPDEHSAEEG